MTTSAATDVLLERARAWAAEDPDDATRTELEQLIADVAGGADPSDLADRFAGTLEFGTAGLRGAVGAGPNRMNRVVVIRAAAGLAAYLRTALHDQGATGPVVVGFDARHRSDDFARDTAEVMSGAGFKVWVMPRPLPTPVVAFAIRELGCAAGVMVTASHNPPQDNGYKVYLGDGSQIVPPADAGIAARIDAVGALRDVPRGPGGTVLGEHIVDRYLDTIAELAAGRAARPRPRLHAAARRRRHVGAPGARDCRLQRAAGGRAAGAAGPGLPDRVVPQPGGAGRDGPRAGAGRGARRRPGRRQRPGRRPLRGRRTDRQRLADAARRRGGRAARAPPDVARPLRHLGDVDRLLEPARADGGRRGPAVRRDADRLQVDRPGPGPGLRLRGGARLLLRPRPREGQGRRLGPAAALRAGGADQGGRPHPGRRPRRPRDAARPARHRPGLRARRRPVADRRRDGAAARGPAQRARWSGGRAGRRPRRSAARTCRPPTGCGSTSPTVPGSSYARAAPSRSSSATWRWSSRSTPRRASTQPGSRRRPGWTRSARTPPRRSGCSPSSASDRRTTKKAAVATSAAIQGQAGSRRICRASSSASGEYRLTPRRTRSSLTSSWIRQLDEVGVVHPRAPSRSTLAISPRIPPISSRARCIAEPFIAWRSGRPTPAQT